MSTKGRTPIRILMVIILLAVASAITVNAVMTFLSDDKTLTVGSVLLDIGIVAVLALLTGIILRPSAAERAADDELDEQ